MQTCVHVTRNVIKLFYNSEGVFRIRDLISVCQRQCSVPNQPFINNYPYSEHFQKENFLEILKRQMISENLFLNVLCFCILD